MSIELDGSVVLGGKGVSFSGVERNDRAAYTDMAHYALSDYYRPWRISYTDINDYVYPNYFE
jgi:hypothetical protein